MVSSSSSPCKKSHRTTTTTSLNSLPDELLVEISLRVAASSLSKIRNLELVSKRFKGSCNNGSFFRRLSLRKTPLFAWHLHHREKFSKFFKTCVENENPEALYRQGIVDYFHLDNDEPNYERGISSLAQAASKGHEEAQYVYGMILICRGGKLKQMGFNILSSLIKPLMSSTMKEMEKLRENIRDRILWRGEPIMSLLKRDYVRENCNCDGRTEMFLAKYCDPNGYYDENKVDMVLLHPLVRFVCGIMKSNFYFKNDLL